MPPPPGSPACWRSGWPNADVPPFLYSAYAEEVEGYIADLNDRAGREPDRRPRPAECADHRVGSRRGGCGGAHLRAARRRGTDTRELRRLARALRRQERLLTAARGLPDRAWFKHQIYAPGRVTGYAAVFLPALDEAIEDGDAAIAEEYRDLIVRRLARADRGVGGRGSVATTQGRLSPVG